MKKVICLLLFFIVGLFLCLLPCVIAKLVIEIYEINTTIGILTVVIGLFLSFVSLRNN